MPPAPFPATSLHDVTWLLILTVPFALLGHVLCAWPTFRAAYGNEPLSQPAYRKLYWSFPSLLLTWVPFVVMMLGYIGCSLLRDVGYLIFPWPILCVSILFGITFYVCQLLRQRLIRQRLPQP